jgi:hypothetical protein
MLGYQAVVDRADRLFEKPDNLSHDDYLANRRKASLSSRITRSAVSTCFANSGL